MLNINGNTNDPYYRYKMPELQSRKAGKGNGCYTILENLENVTKSFNHPAKIVFKYMGIVLGSNTTESKWSITGHYENDEFVSVLYKYIDAFVVCPKCEIPELLPTIEGKKKNKKLIMNCSACGQSTEIYGVNKYDKKGVELIIKYLENNEWKIQKGTMVQQSDAFDPFNQILK